jgi:hypothetical protein
MVNGGAGTTVEGSSLSLSSASPTSLSPFAEAEPAISCSDNCSKSRRSLLIHQENVTLLFELLYLLLVLLDIIK